MLCVNVPEEAKVIVQGEHCEKEFETHSSLSLKVGGCGSKTLIASDPLLTDLLLLVPFHRKHGFKNRSAHSQKNFVSLHQLQVTKIVEMTGDKEKTLTSHLFFVYISN